MVSGCLGEGCGFYQPCWPPLHIAASKGHLDVVYYLARHGADLAHVGNDGWTARAIAQRMGHRRIVTLLKAMQSAGGWCKYVARMRLPYCLIRHEVSGTELVCPVNEDEAGEQGLYHFVFGARDEVVEQGPVALLRAAPDDVFASGSVLELASEKRPADFDRRVSARKISQKPNHSIINVVLSEYFEDRKNRPGATFDLRPPFERKQ